MHAWRRSTAVSAPPWAAIKGKSGENMVQILARANFTINQKPDMVCVSCGHNDAILTAAGASTGMTRWNAIYEALRAGLPDAHIFLCTTLPSTEQTQTQATRDAIWTQQLAYDGRDGGKTKVIPQHVGFDPTAGVHTRDGTHLNEKGAAQVGAIRAAALSAIVEATTEADILDSVTAGTGYGANLDTRYALTGTTGTKSGTTTPTGNVATGKRVVNNTTAAVACDNQTVPGTQIIDITGSVTTANTILFNDAANLNPAAHPGEFCESVQKVQIDDGAGGAPANLRNYGTAISNDIAGVQFGYGSSGTYSAAVAGARTFVLRTTPRAIQAANQTMNNEVGVRLLAGTADVRLMITKPIFRKVETVAYAAPFYLGNDGASSSGATQDTVGITGTPSGANVMTGSRASSLVAR
jgi:hypothetical protein